MKKQMKLTEFESIDLIRKPVTAAEKNTRLRMDLLNQYLINVSTGKRTFS